MKENNRNARPANGPAAAAAYSVLSLLLFPVTLAGYMIWIGKALVSGRRSGVSGTAQGSLSARYFTHRLGTREDEPAVRLMTALPTVPAWGLRLFVWPMLLAKRATGYVPKAFRYPFEGEVLPQYQAAARMTFFDQALERSLAGVSQFVILGAGFDTRAFRLPRSARIRSFEVDAPKTQAVKRAALEKAGIDASGVAFVAADFEKEDWFARLAEAGFDPRRPAFFLWEGVTPYLERYAVESTLRAVAGTAKGSRIAFDYFSNEPLASPGLYWRYARWGTAAAGEPLRFGIDAAPPLGERLAELLRRCGLALEENRTLGKETEGRRAWGGFAVAVVA